MDFNNKIQINDVMLIKNPAKTRPFWKLGRVTELFQGNDGYIRSARITRGRLKRNVARTLCIKATLVLGTTFDYNRY